MQRAASSHGRFEQPQGRRERLRVPLERVRLRANGIARARDIEDVVAALERNLARSGTRSLVVFVREHDVRVPVVPNQRGRVRVIVKPERQSNAADQEIRPAEREQNYEPTAEQ